MAAIANIIVNAKQHLCRTGPLTLACLVISLYPEQCYPSILFEAAQTPLQQKKGAAGIACRAPVKG